MKTLIKPRFIAIVTLLSLAALPAFGEVIYEPYTFATVAGQPGGLGNADGIGSSARFTPYAWYMVIDSDDNLYVPEWRTFRKITPDGVVTTFGDYRLPIVSGFVRDSAGNFYFSSNHAVQKLTPAGELSYLAGSPGHSGSKDGQGAEARFNNPGGLAMDPSGNFYVADVENSTVRKITPEGLVTTLAGRPGSSGVVDGIGNAARFRLNRWGMLVLDRAGNLYVPNFNTLRKVTPEGVVTTLAGRTSVNKLVDGAGSSAGFFNIEGLAIDTHGNIYANDSLSVIRKITLDGVVTTLAGSGSAYGYADGNGANARFSDIDGMVTDKAGNIFVADKYNFCIRKITPDGSVTTIAGRPRNAGNVDGAGAEARFVYPAGLALDGTGHVYVGDSRFRQFDTITNSTVRKLSPGGEVTTLAGKPGLVGAVNGIGSAARFNGSAAVALDKDGNVYVTDTHNNRIRRIAPDGLVTNLAGPPAGSASGYVDGPADQARFFAPNGLAVDSLGNVFVADGRNNRIRKVSPDHVVTTVAEVNLPSAVVIGGDGHLYVSSASENVIHRITSEGGVTLWAGQVNDHAHQDGSRSEARFFLPRGLAFDRAGNLYVADSGNHVIRKITPAGRVTTLAGSPGVSGGADGTGSLAQFNDPNGIVVDAEGNLYVSNSGEGTIRKGFPALSIQAPPLSQTVITGGPATFAVEVSGPGPFTYRWRLNGTNLADIITTVAGTGVAGFSGDRGLATSARVTRPQGLAADKFGNLFITDSGNSRIRKVDPSGVITTVAGRGTEGFSGDRGLATNALISAQGGAVDTVGNFYFADFGGRIRKVDTNGIITTVAGNGRQTPIGNGGAATNAALLGPDGVAVDLLGNLYISEYTGNRIRKVDTNGIITAFAGTGTAGFSGDGGAATDAQLDRPQSVAVDNFGNVFIADRYNHRVRRVDLNGVITTIAGNGTGGPASGDGGPALDAVVGGPVALALDSMGNLFVATGNFRVRKVDANGIISTAAGTNPPGFSGDGGPATEARLELWLSGLALDTSGNLLIADQGNNRVRKVTFRDRKTLEFQHVGAADAGLYDVVVSSSFGSITSSVAQLTVLDANARADDFADGNDEGWQRYDVLRAVGGTPATFEVKDGAYHLHAPSSPNPAVLGPPRAGAFFPTNEFTDFSVSVDVLDWDNAGTMFGVLARIHNIGIGKSSGYYFRYCSNCRNLDIDYIRNEQGFILARREITLDPAKDYRFVFTGIDEYLRGDLYDLANPATPIVTLTALDKRYASGLSGILIANFTLKKGDATFDNYVATPAVGEVPGFSTAITLTAEREAKLQFKGNPASSYEIQASSDLGATQWTTLGTKEAGPDRRFEFVDPETKARSMRIYRLRKK